MLRRRPASWLLPLLALATPASAVASEGHGVAAETWLLVAAILLAAKLGGEIAIRLKQPPVLGELCAGILLGNLELVGIETFRGAGVLPSIELLAELGVVLLLFEVGLESTIVEMRKVAPQSGLVAVIGVVAPMALGFGVSALILPNASVAQHLFIGAALCATSVGITARVVKDLGAMDRDETRIVLGAAVIDDVLGLIVLAIVSAIAQQGHMPDGVGLAKIVGLATGFLVGALLLGVYVTPRVFRAASQLEAPGVLGAVAIGLCFLFSGISAGVGLAAIVGAFAAGLILDEVHVRPFGHSGIRDLSELVSPIVAVLAPIFFVRTGMMVQLGSVGTQPLLLAVALTVVAIAGKLVAGVGARGEGVNRMTIGIGMVPRGEVGLIFADAGRKILVAGEPVIAPPVYMAIVLMVIASTVVAPPWLAWQLRRTLVTTKARAPGHEAQSPP